MGSVGTPAAAPVRFVRVLGLERGREVGPRPPSVVQPLRVLGRAGEGPGVPPELWAARTTGFASSWPLPLLPKSLQFDKEQTAALTEANEVLKKQVEELQQEATR